MFTKHRLLTIQIILFLLVTICSLTAGIYFPNLPPFLRSWFPKGSVVLDKNADPKIDNRFLDWFNRDPEREIPTQPNIIVSPADGFITAIETYGASKHVVIEMRYTDVHVQRVPISGKVIHIEGEGQKLPKHFGIGDYTSDKMAPYQKVTTIESEIGVVKVRQITSYFAQRIQIFINIGDGVDRGQRLGRVLAGSTVVLEVPKEVSILITKNQDVTGGETIIGNY